MRTKFKKSEEDNEDSLKVFETALVQLFNSVPLGKFEITQDEPPVYDKFQLTKTPLGAWKRLGPLFLSML